MTKMILIAALSATALAQPALAETKAPDPVRMKATVEKLVSFGTRHTLSSATDPKRGIGAARTWGAGEFQKISKACGGCLTVETIADRFTGPRAPDGVEVVDVLAIQKGTGDPSQVVIVAGHIDSRVTDVMNITSDAPGANDNASGTALVIEAARVLAGEKFDGTIVYALLSGEEQGLWGGKLLAATAKARGWQVRAMLNNDIVGNTLGQNGQRVADRVRVFSEGIRFSEDGKANLTRRAIGGGMMALRARWPRRLTGSPRPIRRSGWTCLRCGGSTGSGAGAIIRPSWTWAFRRCAFRWGSKIMTGSIRICGPKMAGSMAIRSRGWTFPIWRK
jgi:hypothetical protein